MKIMLLVIDGFGLGAFPDALNRSVEIYGKIIKNAKIPNFAKFGVYNINNQKTRIKTMGSYGNLKSVSTGTDIVTLYFEMAGLHIKNLYPTYPEGLPNDLLNDLELELGTNLIGNIVVDGSRIINDLGALHYNTGFPIIYTSSKSIMYIAAHEDIIPPDKLYEMSIQAREIMQGEHNIARIMATPFNGTINNFTFTEDNKCYTVAPPASTMLDVLQMKGIEVLSFGKINEIFNTRSINKHIETNSNEECFKEINNYMETDKDSLIFASIETADLSRIDDINFYTKCVEDIDKQIGMITKSMNIDDLMIITSNHTYEPPKDKGSTPNYMIPLMFYGSRIRPGIDFNTANGLYCVAHTILDYCGVKGMNKSLLPIIEK